MGTTRVTVVVDLDHSEGPEVTASQVAGALAEAVRGVRDVYPREGEVANIDDHDARYVIVGVQATAGNP